MDEFDLLEDVARRQATKYYGKYRGFVTDVKDPDNRGRVKVTVPSILGEGESQWAEPCFPYVGWADAALIAVPPVGAAIFVEFIEGDASAPVWVGGFIRDPNDMPEDYRDQLVKMIRTETGHMLIFDDFDEEPKITLHSSTDAKVEMDHEGSIQLTGQDGALVKIDAAAGEIVVEDANGNSITMSASGIACEDANGNQITTSASGVEVKGTTINIEGSSVTVGGAGGEPLIKGSTFLSLFNSHTHPCTAPGSPSGPPVVPLTPAALTTKTVAS